MILFSGSDPYLWLENITGDRALAWVHEQNARTVAQLGATADFESLRKRLLNIYNSPQRIPYVVKFGPYYYNFWRDAEHVRGIWRRTTLDQYRLDQPAWETVLDLDKLAADEKENWVWEDVVIRKPDYQRCLICLSRGGADAVVTREFDLTSKQFVDGGFYLPEAKSNCAWLDNDTLYVATDFGPGSLTSSGYPRIVKRWKRGAALADATTVFEVKPDDVGAGPVVLHDRGRFYELMDRQTTIFNDVVFVRRGDQWVKVPKPDDAEWQTFGDYLLIRPKSDWNVGGQVWPAGSLLAIRFDRFVDGDRNFTQLFAPGERTSLDSFGGTKNYVILNVMDNVSSRPELVRLDQGQWTRVPMDAPKMGRVVVDAVDPDESNDLFITSQGFLNPPSFSLATAGVPGSTVLKSLPALFDAAGLDVQQHEAISADGTRIPYFQIGPKDLKLDGNNPTLLYGYGGFEIPLQPYYSAGVGTAWLGRGGVFVIANIRGGGEFGPAWHDAARKEHRQRAYDDFIAVAQDLIARRVTSTPHLGIEGRSNGGLLMGVMLTERPDLFGAVVCGSPLLDMKRYTHLLAGASWIDEYGDPDKPQDWAYISKYSPYQNTSKDKVYPPVLFTTSTRDDRVHPGHARKMAALLEEEGHTVLYYENTEGGHGAAANLKQQAFMDALSYTFLWNNVK